MSIIFKVVFEGERPAISDRCPVDLRRLLLDCYQPDPAKRPNCKEVLERLRQQAENVEAADKADRADTAAGSGDQQAGAGKGPGPPARSAAPGEPMLPVPPATAELSTASPRPSPTTAAPEGTSVAASYAVIGSLGTLQENPLGAGSDDSCFAPASHATEPIGRGDFTRGDAEAARTASLSASGGSRPPSPFARSGVDLQQNRPSTSAGSVPSVPTSAFAGASPFSALPGSAGSSTGPQVPTSAFSSALTGGLGPQTPASAFAPAAAQLQNGRGPGPFAPSAGGSQAPVSAFANMSLK